MPTNRPNLMLDEQSFQGLLAAAFTIQEHNDRIRQSRKISDEAAGRAKTEATSMCPLCGAAKFADAARCSSCGQEEYRPGERLQRNWASLWTMGQEQGLWPARAAETGDGERQLVTQGKERSITATMDWSAEEAARDDFNMAVGRLVPLQARGDLVATDATTDGSVAGTKLWKRLTGFGGYLSWHRADAYLGVAVLMAALALLWPSADRPRQATLSPWERALVTLGIAEAPAPVMQIQGDPGVQVWVDPHTALYYCPGEEQYGKTANGRYSSQRDAQMDRFEPAGRSACE